MIDCVDEMVLYLKNLKAQQDLRRARKYYNHAWDEILCVSVKMAT